MEEMKTIRIDGDEKSFLDGATAMSEMKMRVLLAIYRLAHGREGVHVPRRDILLEVDKHQHMSIDEYKNVVRDDVEKWRRENQS